MPCSADLGAAPAPAVMRHARPPVPHARGEGRGSAPEVGYLTPLCTFAAGACGRGLAICQAGRRRPGNCACWRYLLPALLMAISLAASQGSRATSSVSMTTSMRLPASSLSQQQRQRSWCGVDLHGAKASRQQPVTRTAPMQLLQRGSTQCKATTCEHIYIQMPKDREQRVSGSRVIYMKE